IRTILAEEYGDAELIVIKDPRMCRFMPLYSDALNELGVAPRFVLTHRNPLAVMASLRKRNSMTPGFAALLWLRHTVDAVSASHGHKRCFPSHEAFLDDWRGTPRRAASELDIAWPRGEAAAAASVDGYLRRDLQHHAPSLAELDKDERVNGWVK